jgi:succinate dehydrogenase hydrophobic anchor subunit
MITKFHENLFKGTLAISTLGASITFQVVIQQIAPEEDKSIHHTFRRKTTRNFLAIAWLLFVVALGVASLAAIMLALNQDRFRDEEENRHRETYEKVAAGTSGLLLFVMLAAFLFCSLAVTSYCEGAGWAGVALSAVFMVLSFCIWLVHIL